MNRRVVISQPLYLPWAGFFDQISRADVLIWLDDAQFSKGSFINRNQVISGDEKAWLTIPLEGKGSYQRILDLREANSDWKQAHRQQLQRSLSSRPFVEDAVRTIETVWDEFSVCEILIKGVESICDGLGILAPEILRSSSMRVPGKGSSRVLDLVKKVGGSEYITGHGAAAYLKHEEFDQEEIAVQYMEYEFTPWSQGNRVFDPGVTVLDLIASVGIGAAKNHFKSKQIPWKDFLSDRQVNS